MIKNMGMIDRRIRGFVLAPLFLLLAWVLGFATVGGIIAIVLAAIMGGTAMVGTCPLYLPVHINTDTQADHS